MLKTKYLYTCNKKCKKKNINRIKVGLFVDVRPYEKEN